MRRGTFLALLPVVALFPVVASSVAACSKTPLGSSSPPADRAQQIASAFCSALKACCATAHFGYDDASCEAQLVAEWQATLDGAKRPNTTFDADAFARCEKALADREAECTGDSGAPPGQSAGFVTDVDRACFGIVKGSLAAGAPCTDGVECATESPSRWAYCVQDGDPSSPTFTQRYCATSNPHALPGEPCAGPLHVQSPSNPTWDYCEPSLGYCVATGAADGTCAAFPAVGQSCGGGATRPECGPDSFCQVPDSGAPTCAPFPGPGERCGQSLYGPVCHVGSYCDATSNTCAASKPTYAECKAPQECQSGNCARVASPDGGASPGKCVPPYPSFTRFDVSPRSCGFGPNGAGPDDAGIAR